MKLIKNDLKNATLEAIYWWNRDEFFYHHYFSNLNNIYKNESALDFFTTKIFETFTKEYSVRRNISSGYHSIKIFIEELQSNNFVKKVKAGDIEIIDTLSTIIKNNNKSTSNNTLSLLSKISFLINPNTFCLYDSLAKKAASNIFKDNSCIKPNKLDSYSHYYNCFKYILESLDDKAFNDSFIILKKFSNSEAFKYFSKNKQAFKHRILDKYFWLYQQRKDGNKIISNEGYLKIYKI